MSLKFPEILISLKSKFRDMQIKENDAVSSSTSNAIVWFSVHIFGARIQEHMSTIECYQIEKITATMKRL